MFEGLKPITLCDKFICFGRCQLETETHWGENLSCGCVFSLRMKVKMQKNVQIFAHVKKKQYLCSRFWE